MRCRHCAAVSSTSCPPTSREGGPPSLSHHKRHVSTLGCLARHLALARSPVEGAALLISVGLEHDTYTCIHPPAPRTRTRPASVEQCRALRSGPSLCPLALAYTAFTHDTSQELGRDRGDGTGDAPSHPWPVFPCAWPAFLDHSTSPGQRAHAAATWPNHSSIIMRPITRLSTARHRPTNGVASAKAVGCTTAAASTAATSPAAASVAAATLRRRTLRVTLPLLLSPLPPSGA